MFLQEAASGAVALTSAAGSGAMGAAADSPLAFRGIAHSTFAQQKEKLQHDLEFYPFRDPFDTSLGQVCEKCLWFLVLLLPILTAVLVSVFLVGCPTCCSCCCFSDLASSASRKDTEQDQTQQATDEAHNTQGAAEQKEQAEDSQLAELDRLFSDDAGARVSAFAPELSMLEEAHQPSPAGGAKRRSCRVLPRREAVQCCWINCALWTVVVAIVVLIEWLCICYAVYDQHWDHNPRTRVVIISSAGGSGHMVAADNLVNLMVVRTNKTKSGSELVAAAGEEAATHFATRQGRSQRRPGPTQTAQSEELSTPSTGGSTNERPDFLTGAGAPVRASGGTAGKESALQLGRGPQLQEESTDGTRRPVDAQQHGRSPNATPSAQPAHGEPSVQQTGREQGALVSGQRAKGWIPYAGADPIRLEEDEVEVIYGIPPDKCGKKKGASSLQACQRRSWMNLPLISVAMVELLCGKVLADVGVWGRDKWNAAQKKGDLDHLRQYVSEKDLAEKFFGHNYQAAVTQYLDRHPSVELVVSTQPISTVPIYKAVVAANDRGAKDIQFVLQMTDPPSRFNFFLPGIRQWQAEVDSSQRGHYHLDAPRAGTYQGTVKAMDYWLNRKEDTLQRASRDYYKGLGLEVPALDRMREGDGVLRPPFQILTDDYASRGSDEALANLAEEQAAQSRGEDVLRNLKNVYGEGKKIVDIPIRHGERVVSIMIGGKAAIESTLDYLRSTAMREMQWKAPNKTTPGPVLSATARLTDLCQPTTIFVFCGHNAELGREVLREADKIKKMSGPGPANFRKDLRVYALGWQGADMVAAIYRRANVIVVRGGGVSAFEVRAAEFYRRRVMFLEGQADQVVVHTERPLEKSGPKRICTGGMLKHELGNAAWLSEILGAWKVWLCDRKLCYAFGSKDLAKKTGGLTLDKDPNTDYPCLAPAFLKLDYG